MARVGDAVVEMATAPLRARLVGLLRPAGLQRRQVTVLFADVASSTAMAQGLDAEDTLDLPSGALRRMAALVDARQGRVLRFTGDGVKAVFGMDEAREDDAEQRIGNSNALFLAHGPSGHGSRHRLMRSLESAATRWESTAPAIRPSLGPSWGRIRAIPEDHAASTRSKQVSGAVGPLGPGRRRAGPPERGA